MRNAVLYTSGAAVAAALSLVLARSGPSPAGPEQAATPWPGAAALPNAFQPPAAETRPGDGFLTAVEPARVATPLPTAPAETAPPADAPRPFARFPFDRPQTIAFDMDGPTRDRLTAREQADQLRDWVLYAVVGDAGLTADEFNRALYDVPPVRHGHMRAVAHFEYGTVRSAAVGDGRVAAVVPVCPEAEFKDHLAHIADEHRKSLGRKPTTVHVFAYELNASGTAAAVTRRPDVAGAALFTETYGYHEARVGDLADFRAFMEKVQDLTFAAQDGDRLTLGGRKLLARAYRGLRVEDVAAVWQAQDKLNRDRAALEAEFRREMDDLKDVWQKKLDKLNADLRAGRVMPGGAPEAVPDDPDDPLDFLRRPRGNDNEELRKILEGLRRQRPGGADPVMPRGGLGGFGRPADPNRAGYEQQARALQKGFDAAATDLQQKQAQRFYDAKLPDHTGFSLDPTYDFAGLEKWFNETARPRLQEVAGPAAAREAEQASRALHGNDPVYKGEDRAVPVLILLDKLKKVDEVVTVLVADALSREMRKFKFQGARYDGALDGTEVGMVLFYTDLLAKLWESVDFGAPKLEVPGFETSPVGGVPPLFKVQTFANSSTRLWFAPYDRYFQLANGRREVGFARTATRIFAASSNPLEPGKETPPTYQAERGIGWWNDHFEEVARFEPEYERLNEYIKWSVVIAWLHNDKALGKFDFLSRVGVDHGAWFPEWAKKKSELRYRAWEKVAFLERGAYGSKTETMPILYSRFFASFGEAGERYQISGGVGGARPKELLDRAVLPERLTTTAKLSLRGADPKSVGDGNSLTTLRGTKFEFRDLTPTTARIESTPKAELGLRSTHGELAPTSFTRTTDRAGGGSTVSVESAAGRLGALSLTPTGSGFRVGYQSREVDAGQNLARAAAASPDPKAAVAGDPRARVAYEAPNGELFVKLAGSDKWVRLARDANPPAAVPAGWQGRASDTGVGAKTFNVAWVDRPPPEFGAVGEPIVVAVRPLLDARPSIPVFARGPPGGGKPPGGGRPFAAGEPGDPYHFRGVFDAKTGHLVIDPTSVKPGIVKSPEAMSELVAAADWKSAHPRLTAPGTDTVAVAFRRPPADPADPYIRALEQGNPALANAAVADRGLDACRAARAADLPRRLDTLDGYAQRGEWAEVRAAADAGLRVHPDNPHLLQMKGLAEYAAGARPFPHDLPLAADRRAGYLHGGTAADPPGVLKVRAAVRERAVRDLKAANKMPAEISTASGSPAVEGVYAEPLPRNAARPADVTPRDVVLIAENSGLGTRDWSATGRQRTLREVVGSGGATLYEVRNPDAGLRRGLFDRVAEPARGAAAEARRYVNTAGLAFRPARPGYAYAYHPHEDCDDDEDEDGRDPCAGRVPPRRVFLVALKEAAPVEPAPAPRPAAR